MAQYVMTLSGPKKVSLLGPVTDTVSAHPIALVAGLVAGLFLGLRRRGKRGRR